MMPIEFDGEHYRLVSSYTSLPGNELKLALDWPKSSGFLQAAYGLGCTLRWVPRQSLAFAEELGFACCTRMLHGKDAAQTLVCDHPRRGKCYLMAARKNVLTRTRYEFNARLENTLQTWLGDPEQRERLRAFAEKLVTADKGRLPNGLARVLFTATRVQPAQIHTIDTRGRQSSRVIRPSS